MTTLDLEPFGPLPAKLDAPDWVLTALGPIAFTRGSCRTWSPDNIRRQAAIIAEWFQRGVPLDEIKAAHRQTTAETAAGLDSEFAVERWHAENARFLVIVLATLATATAEITTR